VGDLHVPPEGAHIGAPLRFVSKFLTATQSQASKPNPTNPEIQLHPCLPLYPGDSWDMYKKTVIE
jgi:hypothetical protein